MSLQTTTARMRACIAEMSAEFLNGAEMASVVRELLRMSATEVAQEFASWRADAPYNIEVQRAMRNHGF